MKFKKGDKITASEYGMGFEDATVKGVVNENGRKYYVLNIVNGTATVPVSAESNYKLKE